MYKFIINDHATMKKVIDWFKIHPQLQVWNNLDLSLTRPDLVTPPSSDQPHWSYGRSELIGAESVEFHEEAPIHFPGEWERDPLFRVRMYREPRRYGQISGTGCILIKRMQAKLAKWYAIPLHKVHYSYEYYGSGLARVRFFTLQVFSYSQYLELKQCNGLESDTCPQLKKATQQG